MLLQCVSGENYWLLHLPHSWVEERTEKELPECSGERSPWGVCCGFKKAGLLLRPLTLTQCLSRIQLGIESGVLQGLGSTTNMWACFAPIKMIKRTWVDSPKMVNPELVGEGETWCPYLFCHQCSSERIQCCYTKTCSVDSNQFTLLHFSSVRFK